MASALNKQTQLHNLKKIKKINKEEDFSSKRVGIAILSIYIFFPLLELTHVLKNGAAQVAANCF